MDKTVTILAASYYLVSAVVAAFGGPFTTAFGMISCKMCSNWLKTDLAYVRYLFVNTLVHFCLALSFSIYILVQHQDTSKSFGITLITVAAVYLAACMFAVWKWESETETGDSKKRVWVMAMFPLLSAFNVFMFYPLIPTNAMGAENVNTLFVFTPEYNVTMRSTVQVDYTEHIIMSLTKFVELSAAFFFGSALLVRATSPTSGIMNLVWGCASAFQGIMASSLIAAYVYSFADTVHYSHREVLDTVSLYTSLILGGSILIYVILEFLLKNQMGYYHAPGIFAALGLASGEGTDGNWMYDKLQNTLPIKKNTKT